MRDNNVHFLKTNSVVMCQSCLSDVIYIFKCRNTTHVHFFALRCTFTISFVQNRTKAVKIYVWMTEKTVLVSFLFQQFKILPVTVRE